MFNAFTKFGGSSAKWCSTHRINFKALSRAVTIRAQLKKYLLRFTPKGARIESCEGDHKRLRKCLGELPRRCRASAFLPAADCSANFAVTGYFKNAARWNAAEGTYISVRENTVRLAAASWLNAAAPWLKR